MAKLSKEFRILFLIGLDTVFFLLEIIIGYAVNSLALIADAFHMVSFFFFHFLNQCPSPNFHLHF